MKQAYHSPKRNITNMQLRINYEVQYNYLVNKIEGKITEC